MTMITSRVANALIENVQVLSEANPIAGGLWVGGRVTLSTTDVQFHANAVNRSLQSGELDITVDLRSIESVELLPGVLTKIVAMHTGERVFKIRCFGAAKLAEQIQAAASAARTDGGK
jgi:hypothetical protein